MTFNLCLFCLAETGNSTAMSEWNGPLFVICWVSFFFFFLPLQLFTKFYVFLKLYCSCKFIIEYCVGIQTWIEIFFAENVVDCMLVASESILFEWLLVNFGVLCWASESWTTLEINETVRKLDQVSLYIMEPAISTDKVGLKAKRVAAEIRSY